MFFKRNTKPPTPRNGTYFGDRDEPSHTRLYVSLAAISAVTLVICYMQETIGTEQLKALVSSLTGR